MTIKKHWLDPICFALGVGALLAAFVCISMLYETDLSVWLWANDSLIVVSLLIAFAVGFRLRAKGFTILSVILGVAAYYTIVMLFYVGSYAVMTYYFSGQVAWIPFFHRDYTYHGFGSVRDYMEHKENFRDLLVLQIISCLISSVMYFAAGMIGAIVGNYRWSSTTT